MAKCLHFFLLSGFLSIAASFARAEVIELKFEDLPQLLQERNQAVQGSQLSVQASQQRTGHLLRSFLPTLSLDAGGEHFQTGSYPAKTEPYAFLETRINLFRGGRDRIEENVRMSQVIFAEAQAKKTLIEELTDA